MSEISKLVTNLKIKINNIRQGMMKLDLETETVKKERYNQINDIETIIFELEKIEENKENEDPTNDK